MTGTNDKKQNVHWPNPLMWRIGMGLFHLEWRSHERWKQNPFFSGKGTKGKKPFLMSHE